MTKKSVSLAALLLLATTAVACGRGADRQAGVAAAPPPPVVNPSDFSPTVDNPLFPLSSFGTVELVGTERGSGDKTIQTREVTRRLDKTDTIAGVTVAILEVTEYADGEIVEQTEDYFAQHHDGTVWYFGERVSDYKDGKVVGHGGQWLAGEGGNRPGVYMPAKPAVGQEFVPEPVPGVDERSKVLQLDVEVTVPAGRFTGCIKVEELEDNVSEFKYFCPRVGLARSEGPDGSAELVRIG